MEDTGTESTDAKEKNVYLELWVYKILQLAVLLLGLPWGTSGFPPKSLGTAAWQNVAFKNKSFWVPHWSLWAVMKCCIKNQQWSHIMIDFKPQCPLGLVVICQLLQKMMNLLLRCKGWLFECVAIEYLQPSGDSFMSEYFVHVLTFLYLNAEHKGQIFLLFRTKISYD